MRIPRYILAISTFVIFPGLFVAHASAGPNLAQNPGFEIANTPSYTNYSGGKSGLAGAANWAALNANSPTLAWVTTDLLPSTAPGGGQQMIHVTTNASGTGLEQGIYIPAGIGAHYSVSIYVVQGQVGTCLGPIGTECNAPPVGSGPSLTAADPTDPMGPGKWVTLSGSTTGEVRELLIVSYVPSPSAVPYTDYYVDNVVVTSP